MVLSHHPMVLVNGAEGIGTGWSTKLPNYDVREIIANIKRMLDGEDPLPMVPSYKNFKGTIEELSESRFIASGEVAIIDDQTVEITELPIRTWTQNYKEDVLEIMLHGTEKTPSMIMDFKEYHTDSTVKFVVKMTPEKLQLQRNRDFTKSSNCSPTFPQTQWCCLTTMVVSGGMKTSQMS